MRILCKVCEEPMDYESLYCPVCKTVNELIFVPKTTAEFKELCEKNNFDYLREGFRIDDENAELNTIGIRPDGDAYIVYEVTEDNYKVLFASEKEQNAMAFFFRLFTRKLPTSEQRYKVPKYEAPVKPKQPIWIPLLKLSVALAVIAVLLVASMYTKPVGANPGYRKQDDTYYFVNGDAWYIYNKELNNWEYISLDADFIKKMQDIDYAEFFNWNGDNGYPGYKTLQYK